MTTHNGGKKYTTKSPIKLFHQLKIQNSTDLQSNQKFLRVLKVLIRVLPTSPITFSHQLKIENSADHQSDQIILYLKILRVPGVLIRVRQFYSGRDLIEIEILVKIL